ncbi:MAG: DUF1538 family protein, partial [Clostridia bacterium]|nr:DUF1538 family protein [Clostridia bacterium]
VVEDAFGVVAMVAMTPLIAIQVLGLIYKLKLKKKAAEEPAVEEPDVAIVEVDDDIIEM